MLGRPVEHLVEWTPHIGACLMPLYNQGPLIHPELLKDLFEEGFGHSLQVAATELKKLWECKLAKLKGGYSSDTSLVFQSWLQDIWVYVIECHLSQLEAIQLVKDYTSKHAWLKVENYLGLSPKSEQSFQRLIDHFSLIFQSCETVSSLIGDFYNQFQKSRETEDAFANELQILERKLWLINKNFWGGKSSLETPTFL